MSTDAVGERSGDFGTPRASPGSSPTRQDPLPPAPPPAPDAQNPVGCPLCRLIFNQNDGCGGEGVCAVIKSEGDAPAAFNDTFQTLLTHMYDNNFGRFRQHVRVIAAGVDQLHGPEEREEGCCEKVWNGAKNLCNMGMNALCNACGGNVCAWLCTCLGGCLGG